MNPFTWPLDGLRSPGAPRIRDAPVAACVRLHFDGRQSCAKLVASLLSELLGAPGEAAAAAELREALGGFVSPSLEALIPTGAPWACSPQPAGLVARATSLHQMRLITAHE